MSIFYKDTGGGGNGHYFDSTTGQQVAGLQVSGASTSSSRTTGGTGFDTTANIPGANDVEFPDWLSKNPDDNMRELLDTYGGINAAFDPSRQVNARNRSIAINTSVGNQAANNAATEYASRAQQQGGSTLGAGVVKAQSLMPVLGANAKLRTEGADIAAKAHQDAISLASQIADTIGKLRTSHLATLANYTTSQQGLALDKYKAEQGVVQAEQSNRLGYAQIDADKWKTEQANAVNSKDAALKAAQLALGADRPQGNWTTDAYGRITDGQDSYDRDQAYKTTRDDALSYLGGMF